MEKKNFWSSDLYRKWPDFFSQALYKSEIFFFTIGTCLVSKDAEFYVEFKNVNLPLCKIAPKKNYWRKKIQQKNYFFALFSNFILEKIKKTSFYHHEVLSHVKIC
jgi:hypothetical protein